MLPRAKLVSLNIILDYECPNCLLCFRLQYDSFENKKIEPKRCANCKTLIMVDPLPAVRKKQKAIANDGTQSKIRRVKKSLVRMGWSTREAKEAIENNDMTLDEKTILKQIVSSNID